MADFTPIETQEQLNAIIQDRLARDRESQAKKYSDYGEIREQRDAYAKQVEELQKQLEAHAADADTIKALQGQIAGYETDSVKTKAALAARLNPEAWGFIQGNTEDEIKESVDRLVKLTGNGTAPPSRSTEPEPSESKEAAMNAALKQVLSGLNLNNNS